LNGFHALCLLPFLQACRVYGTPSRTHQRSHVRKVVCLLDRIPQGHFAGCFTTACCDGRNLQAISPALTCISGSMQQESAMSSEYHKSHGREALRFEPKPFLRNSEGAPRHVILGLDATKSNRPISAAGSYDKVKWPSKEKFYTILNLSPTGHMPGYRGHIPEYKYAAPGQPFGKATTGRISIAHPSLSAELYQGR